MVEVYYYMPVEKVNNVVECGMKLSEWFDKEVFIGGEVKKCMSALLNPKDDMSKYKSADYKCVKLELSPNYCFVADKFLYHTGLKSDEVMELYKKSIIPIGKYIFGSYRLPECLVTSTIIPGQVSALHKMMDSPVLYDNSEELYITNIIESNKEIHDNFNDVVLGWFVDKLENDGKMTKIEDRENEAVIYIDKRNSKSYAIKLTSIEEY